MPHDANEVLLSVGDKVVLHGTVKSIDSEQETYCNIVFVADEKMAPEAEDYEISLSARMVKKE